MAAENTLTGIKSIEDALTILKHRRRSPNSARQLVIVTPERATSLRILHSLVAHAGERNSLLISFGEPSERFSKIAHHVVSVSSGEHAALECKKVLRRANKNASIFLEIGDAPRSRRGEFVPSLLRMVAARKSLSVWCIARATLPAASLALLKDEADLFLDIRREGAQNVAQFLAAKGYYSPESFLPRILTITAKASRLSRPVAPKHAGERSAAVQPDEVSARAFENAAEGLVIFELGGEFRKINRRAKEFLGYEESELPRLFDLIPRERQWAAKRALVVLRRKGKLSFSTQVRRKNGQMLEVLIYATSLGKNLFAAVCVDSADRMKLKAEKIAIENEYRAFLSSLPYPYAIFVNRKLAERNEAFTALFPWTAQKTPSLTDFFGRRNADLLKQISELLKQTGGGVRISNREVLIPAPERKSVAAEVSIASVPFAGKPAVYCSFVDVTARRQVLDRAAAVEEKFKTLVEGSLDALSITKDGTFLLVNDAFARLFGYAGSMELLGKKLTTVVWGRNARREVLEAEKQVLAGSETQQQLEYPGRMKDGTKIVVEARSCRISFDGRPAVLSYHRNITELRKSEEELERRSKGFEILNHFIDDVRSSASTEEMYHRGMHAALKASGFETAGVFLLQDDLLVLKHHHGLSEHARAKLDRQSLDESFTRFFNKTHEALIATIAEYPAYLPYRSLFASEGYSTVAILPTVVSGRLHGMLLLATRREITIDEHDRVLLASIGRQLGIAVQLVVLREQVASREERFASTVSTLAEVLYSLQPNGAFTYLSPNIETLTGYKTSDFQQNPNLWRTLLHPDDRPVLSKRISNQTGEANAFHLEYRVLPKGKATYLWLRDSVRYERDTTGRLVAIHGILTDITASKLLAHAGASHAATASVSRTQFDILDLLPDGIALLDANLECIEWNAPLARMTGISCDEAIGKSIHDLQPLGSVLPKLLERKAAGEADPAETLLVHPAGEQKSVALRVRAIPRSVRDGEPGGTIVLVQDTTFLQKLADETQQSQATLRAALATVSDAILICDLDGKVLQTNRAFSEWTGYSLEEAQEATYPWVDEADRERFRAWYAAAKEKAPSVLEVTWRHKDGRPLVVRVRASLLKNNRDEPTGILLIGKDITETQQLALEVERKNKQIALLNRIIGSSDTSADLGVVLKTIATEIHALVPYEGINVSFLDEEQNLFPWYIAIPSDTGESMQVNYLPIDATVVYDAVRTGSPAVKDGEGTGQNGKSLSQVSLPLFVDDKAMGAVSLISSRRKAFGEDDIAFLQPVADHIGAIIQRARLFEQVRNDSAYIHNLLDSINQIVFTVDRNYRITHVNKAWREYMIRQKGGEWAQENRILGQSLEVLMPDAETWQEYKRVMDDLFARRLDVHARDFEVFEGNIGATHHLVISPMVIGEKVTGLVFTQTDITEINRTEAEIKRRNRELVALNTISTSISTSLDLAEILRVAAEQVQEVFEAAAVGFYLHGEDGRLTLTSYRGFSEELASRVAEIDAVNSLAELFGARPTPVYVETRPDRSNLILQSSELLGKRLQLESTALVPLQSKDRLLGTLLIGCRRPHAFTPREEQLLILIGNQLGAAIENAQLYAEIQHQVHTLTTLYELGKGLTGLLDLNSMLQVVYQEVTKALPLDRFYYQAYSPEDNTLTLLRRTVNGVAEFYPAGVKVRALTDWPNRIYQEVVANGTSYMGSTTADASDSMIAVPIKSDNKVIGIISIVASRPNLYTGSHLRLLESIANLTGVAIGKAMLYEDTLKKSAEIENRNKELDDFTYVVSHDLKEPLISIEGYSKIVMKDYQDCLDDEGKEYLSAVVQSTARMKHLIEDLLTLSRLGRMSEAHETVSVRTIIDEILHDFQFSLRERKVLVRVQDHLPHVRYSSTRLAMVFRNLISNAMKFNDKPIPIIEIGCDEDEQDFRFWVKDNGIGIEPQYFDRIFTIFQRLKRSEEYRGTGAGLTIVKKIIEREGGRIWLESAPGVGSTFYFTIKKPT